MSRSYAVRLVVWSVLVVGFGAAAGLWLGRTLPATMRAVEAAEPPVVTEAPAKNPEQFSELAKFVNQPLEWVRHSWLFLVVVAFWVLASWGIVGRPLGVFDLIHAEAGWIRFLNGIAIGFATGSALLVAYHTTTEQVPWTVGSEWTICPVPRDMGLPGEAEAVRRVGNFLLVTWIPVLVLLALPWWVNPRETRAVGRFPAFPLGLFLCVPIGTGLVFAAWSLLAPVDAEGEWRNWYALTPGAADGRIPPVDFPMHVIATVFTALPMLLIIALIVSAKLGRVGSPVWIVSLTLWVFTATYGFVSFHYEGLQLLLLGIAVAVLIVANAAHPYKLGLPNLDPEYQAARAGKPTPLAITESPVGASRVRLLAAEDWFRGFHDCWRSHGFEGKPRMVIVCTSGGGIRAAVWTAAVLEGLERELGSDFSRHIRLITGASGGMVAAALYAGSRVHPLPCDASLAEILAEDCLWPTWQRLFVSDGPSAFTPFYRPWDRGRSLEMSWHRNAPAATPKQRSAMQTTFADLLPAERSGLVPSLIFSPMMVEDGRRLLISNLDLADLASESAPTLGIGADGRPFADRQRLSQPGVEFFRLFPDAHTRFQVGTAARLSAAFPFVSPAVSLPTFPPRRIVDAGFFDNYGVGIAAGWLLRNSDLVRKYCGGVAILEVRAFPLENEKTGFPEAGSEVRAGAGDALTTALAGVSTPAEALGVVRAAGAYYRNDHLLGLLDCEFNCGVESPFFVRVPIECPGAGSLSWAITAHERDRLIHCLKSPDVAGPIEGLRAWFGTGGAG